MPSSPSPPSSLSTSSNLPRKLIGFVLNPIAGMGGRVGLKGTDGPEVLAEAMTRGATAMAHERAAVALKILARQALWNSEAPPLWLACGGSMGGEVLEAAGLAGRHHRFIYFPSGEPTSAQDTRMAVQAMVQEGAELIVFCGGDGTARDVLEALQEAEAGGLGPFGRPEAAIDGEMELFEAEAGLNENSPASSNLQVHTTPAIPVVGIPAGVKMHSAVFGQSPAAAADLIELWLANRAGFREAEVMDVDEAAFRENRLAVKLHGHLRVPYHADLLQGCKCVFGGEDETEALLGIVETFQEEARRAGAGPRRATAENQKGESHKGESQKGIDDEGAPKASSSLKDEPPSGKGILWLLGPGSTVARVKEGLGVKGPTMLGIDALEPDGTAHHDLDEAGLLSLLEAHAGAGDTGPADAEVRLVVSPIGAQGFLFGRGNQQLSPRVLAHLGRERIHVVSTPHKLKETPKLLLDTGDPALDEALAGFYKVTVGYDTSRVTRVEVAGKRQ